MFTWQTYRSIIRAILTRKAPVYIQFYINGRCNLMCRQCNIVETNSRIPELSLDQIEIVARNLQKIGAGIILLTGGEPFLRRDLPQIVEILVRHRLNVRLQTAGSKLATEDQLRACYEAGARDINVSLDSLELDVSDYINAVPGSGWMAVETIERISRVFRDRSNILSFGTVLSRFNYREIPAIVEFARRIGWYVSLVPVHISAQGSQKGFRSFDQQFCFPESYKKSLAELTEALVKEKRHGAPLFDSEDYLRSTFPFLLTGKETWRRQGVCDSPSLYFAIRPNGDFTTCCEYVLKRPPNLTDPDFANWYNRGQVQNQAEVQQIVQHCSGCHYGSYPEITLSVRSPRVLLERALLVVKSGRGQLSKAQTSGSFLEELERVKTMFPDVYPTSQWLDADLAQSIASWKDPQLRPVLLDADLKRRRQEKRERGKGEDQAIGAEPTPNQEHLSGPSQHKP